MYSQIDELSYTARQTMIALSEKIKCLAKKNVPYSENRYDIILNNAKYSLSSLIAHIMLKLTFPNKTRNSFMEYVKNYNMINSTNLTFSDFEKIYWVRVINNEIVIPEMIKSAIWKVTNDASTISDIPVDKKNMVLCLIAYKQSILEPRPYISTENIKTILENIQQDNKAIEYLSEKHIVEYNSEKNLYYWNEEHHYYDSPFIDEVCVYLWNLIKIEGKPEESFRKYFFLLEKTRVFPKNIHSILNENDSAVFYYQANQILQSEDDLKLSDAEFDKIWLDLHHHYHSSLTTPKPNFSLSFDNIYDFFDKIERATSRLQLDFYYQNTREFCYHLLIIIIQYEMKQYGEKKYTLNILTDISRPYLILTLQKIVKRHYSAMIPFLISDLELSPIALELVEKIELNEKMLSGSTGAFQNSEKAFTIKNEIWLELLELILLRINESHIQSEPATNKLTYNDIGKIAVEIFLHLTRQLFSSVTINNPIIRPIIQDRYDNAFKLLCSTKSKKTTLVKGLQTKTRLYFSFLVPMLVSMKNIIEKRTFENSYLSFDSDIFDLGNEILRVADIQVENQELTQTQKTDIENANKELLGTLIDYLQKYLAIEKVTATDYYNTPKQEDVKRGFEENVVFINWGYFFLMLCRYHLFTEIEKIFDNSIKLNISAGEENYQYDPQNRNQYFKLRFFIKILTIAYITISEKKNDFDLINMPIKDTLTELEKVIIKYATKYNTVSKSEKSLDAFDESSIVFTTKEYYEPLATTLFHAVNYFPIDEQMSFSEIFFTNTIDLKQMLSAINRFDAMEVKDIISKKIITINTEDFINSCITVTDWQDTLVEAINSEDYWQLAEPLLERIREHYQKSKYKNDNVNFLLFQCELSIALRKNELTSITDAKFASTTSFSIKEYPVEDTRLFFLAKYHLKNNAFDKSINLLRSLISRDEKNIRYALQLYDAQILESIHKKSLPDKGKINSAYQNWQNFLNNLGDTKDKVIAANYEHIASNDIFYHLTNKNDAEVFQILNRLSQQYLYDEYLIQAVYDFYREKNEDTFAFAYINDARKYYQSSGVSIPTIVEDLFQNPDNATLVEMRRNFSSIITSHYSTIPRIVPDLINNKHDINLFILKEIVDVAKQMQKKIKAIESIKHEDRYSDIIQSLLIRRLSFFTWDVSDQSRTGLSGTGKDAGETDLIIKAGGNDIALIEALFLKDKKWTQSHIKKCTGYNNNLERYYILVYYKGKKGNLDKSWEKYKTDVVATTLPTPFFFVKQDGSLFTDINSEFPDCRSLRISKTNITDGHTIFEMFHVMVDFSS
ncbi:MAG: hypothetical protein Ta2B_13180 [Termitinemataceae bacterium]|nr:MAG: hypothetical protein Ta2B_13180 [Termitinemataceae bacterium]